MNEGSSCAANSQTSHDGVARARWSLLRQVLRGKQSDNPEVKRASVRRFATFELFSRTRPASHDSSDEQWAEYRSVFFPEYGVFLRDNPGPLRVSQVLNSFDNTGNVCVWPSEEAMAHYCLRNRHMFTGAVCELGGGMTCLAGLMVAACADAKEVLLSDGNEQCVDNVRGIVERNQRAGKFGSTRVSTRVLRWEREPHVAAFQGHFDVVICADCLFLEQYRSSLAGAIRSLLRPNGVALVLAPQRGDTLASFCGLAGRAGLLVDQRRRYDAQVWDVHLKMLQEGKEAYDENLHYPLLITLSKGAQA
ncbi:calmodulin-lysine N-methyltransferase [Hippocampus zosterae]|uniref:calmodulin-lysine N-methyltransferase n=1 Tax=Hippocampus zosterae TaxID=109293 RepID=UPI00223CA0C0|nr:calmodulin-lysine N-methyltransferase [Hippocampus zosterae]